MLLSDFHKNSFKYEHLLGHMCEQLPVVDAIGAVEVALFKRAHNNTINILKHPPPKKNIFLFIAP
jgi:hypothetical protein